MINFEDFLNKQWANDVLEHLETLDEDATNELLDQLDEESIELLEAALPPNSFLSPKNRVAAGGSASIYGKTYVRGRNTKADREETERRDNIEHHRRMAIPGFPHQPSDRKISESKGAIERRGGRLGDQYDRIFRKSKKVKKTS